MFLVMSAECGGKMHLREGEFSKAHTDFFEAFKNYDESGSPRCSVLCMFVCFTFGFVSLSGDFFVTKPIQSFYVCHCLQTCLSLSFTLLLSACLSLPSDMFVLKFHSIVVCLSVTAFRRVCP